MNGNGTSSVAEIVAKSREARSNLAIQESALQDEIDEIDDLQWDRPLNANERKQRSQLRATQTDVRMAMIQLSFVTARALDESPEMARLVNAFRAINSDLKKDLRGIQEVAQVVQGIEDAIAQIADIAQSVGELLTPV